MPCWYPLAVLSRVSLCIRIQVLPVVEIDPHTAGISSRNSPVLLTLLALALGYLWGVAAATFLEPAYLGILVCGVCKVSACMYVG